MRNTDAQLQRFTPELESLHTRAVRFIKDMIPDTDEPTDKELRMTLAGIFIAEVLHFVDTIDHRTSAGGTLDLQMYIAHARTEAESLGQISQNEEC